MKRLPLLLLLTAMLASCGSEMHWSERAAQDRIMLVRTQPQTLGHKRLVYQAGSHPDLAVFLRASGDPDFIAEASSDDRQYLILYYLESGKAFAARSWRGRAGSMDFAGPYPMTKKETELLRELKAGSVQETYNGLSTGRLVVP